MGYKKTPGYLAYNNRGPVLYTLRGNNVLIHIYTIAIQNLGFDKKI